MIVDDRWQAIGYGHINMDRNTMDRNTILVKIRILPCGSKAPDKKDSGNPV